MPTDRTHDINIIAKSTYLASESSPKQNKFAWAYEVQIENKGDETVQLIARHWKVVDETGKKLEVSGPGVVGLQPIIKPGEAFGYSSGTYLDSASGIMMGNYHMVNEKGEKFDVEIPAFSLDSPVRKKMAN